MEARVDTNAAIGSIGRGKTALDFAVERGHFHVLKFLAASGANPNSDHFFVAALCDRLEAATATATTATATATATTTTTTTTTVSSPG